MALKKRGELQINNHIYAIINNPQSILKQWGTESWKQIKKNRFLLVFFIVVSILIILGANTNSGIFLHTFAYEKIDGVYYACPGEKISVKTSYDPDVSGNVQYKFSGCDTMTVSGAWPNYTIVIKEEGSYHILADSNSPFLLNNDYYITIGHDWNDDYTVDKSPKCMETGSESIHCKRCNATKDERTIPASGHTWDNATTIDIEPTCTSYGSQSIHCKNCDAKKDITELPLGDHNYGDWETVRKQTCTEDGLKLKTCIYCGNEISENIPSIGHNWNTYYEIDKSPTCTEGGIESKHCKNCDARIEEREIPKVGHSWSAEYYINKYPTCETEGSKVIQCTKCSAIKPDSAISIPAYGHLCVASYIKRSPTCSTKGLQASYCSRCGSEVITEIPTLEHSYYQWQIQASPTVFAQGLENRTCLICGATQYKTVPCLTPYAYFSSKQYTVQKSKRKNLTNALEYASGDYVIKWKVNKKKLAKISKEGVLKGKKNGTVKVTAILASGKLATCKVIIVNKKKVSKSSGRIVFWTPGGYVYHLSKNCPTLSRSRIIKSGSISKSGKSRVCKVCGY